MLRCAVEPSYGQYLALHHCNAQLSIRTIQKHESSQQMQHIKTSNGKRSKEHQAMSTESADILKAELHAVSNS